jgi:hypothetical protein
MTLDPENPTPAEVEDFLCGTLPVARRRAVAAYLATDTEAGAEALAVQAQTELLRAALAPLPAPADAVTRAAGRLSGAMDRRLRLRRMRPFVAAAACFVLGWGGHMLLQRPALPAETARLAPLAEVAMDARQAADIARALVLPGMMGAGDLKRAAKVVGVALPPLPADWQVQGVQVVATPDRPALLVQIVAPGLGEFAMFSLAGADLGPDAPPLAFDHRGAAVAVFERQSSAHVLVDAGRPPADIGRAAGQLVRRLN